MFESILAHAGWILLYIVLAVTMLTTTIGLPGNWITVGAAALISIITGFKVITWPYLLLCVGLAGFGELVERVLGAVVVAKRGGTRYGVIGSIIGGFAGAILGAGFIPPLGSVLFGFVGAFGGAVAGELLKRGDIDPAMRIGFWAFVGRILAMMVKVAAGVGILWVIIAQTW